MTDGAHREVLAAQPGGIEIAAAARFGIALQEGALPIPTPVAAACEMLGFDPLYVANEGVLVVFVPERSADARGAGIARGSWCSRRASAAPVS